MITILLDVDVINAIGEYILRVFGAIVVMIMFASFIVSAPLILFFLYMNIIRKKSLFQLRWVVLILLFNVLIFSLNKLIEYYITTR